MPIWELWSVMAMPSTLASMYARTYSLKDGLDASLALPSMPS
jgi:hypothetical protein